MEELQLRTQTRKEFTRIGLAFAVFLIADQLFPVAMVAWIPWFRDGSSAAMSVLYALTYAIATATLLPFLLPIKPVSSSGLQISVRCFFRTYAFGMGALYLFSFITTAYMKLVELITHTSTSDLLQSAADSLPKGFYIVLVSVIAPVFEEIIFRGLLLSRLRKYGDRFAIIFCGIAFGLFHLNLYQFLYAAALGMLFAALVLKTGKLWHSILLHAMVNSTSSLMSYLAELGGTWDYVLGIFIWALLVLSIWIFIRWRPTYYMCPAREPLNTRIILGGLVRSPVMWIVTLAASAASVAMVFLAGILY